MRKYLFDTNVVLDVLLMREPWHQTAQELWSAHDDGLLKGYLTATTLTDIFYIAQKHLGIDKANTAVDICLKTFEICTVNRQSLILARTYNSHDFEDNLQIACAEQTGLDAIITRNAADFEATHIPVLTPEQTLTQISNS